MQKNTNQNEPSKRDESPVGYKKDVLDKSLSWGRPEKSCIDVEPFALTSACFWLKAFNLSNINVRLAGARKDICGGGVFRGRRDP
jgi:hypothetical protein